MAPSSSMRSLTLVRLNAGKAAFAAATARSTSAALPRLMRPATSSVAGLITSSGFGEAGSTQAPSM